jgi:hypothetical protein
MYTPKYTISLLTKGSQRRSGIKLETTKPAYVDHDTGGPNGTAQNNVDYYRRTQNDIQASASFFTDDKGTIICIPCFPGTAEKAWQVQYQVKTDNALWGDDANDMAIGGELCYFPKDKARSLKAYKNYVEFMAYLAALWKSDPRRRAGHFQLDPARRSDPVNALSYIGKTYKNLCDDILAQYIKEYDTPDPNIPAKYAVEAQKWVRLKGISDGNRPYANTTRIEVWAMLYRILTGKKETVLQEVIDWCIKNNITDGTRPKDNISRVELWALLSRSIGKLPVVVDWKSSANIWVVLNEISDGLSPDEKTERQELWTMLLRCATKLNLKV